jgi:hypothetical protein
VTSFYAAPHKLTTRRGNEDAALVSVRKSLKTAVGVSFEVHVDQPPLDFAQGQPLRCLVERSSTGFFAAGSQTRANPTRAGHGPARTSTDQSHTDQHGPAPDL